MGNEVRLFKSEERKSRTEVTTFLKELAAKIDSGQVILRSGQEELTLEIPENLVLEVQVEDEDKKDKGIEHSLEIEIAWYEGGQQTGGPLELG
ncbi:MAG: amphi-Trp domain-containing protein [Anaerolineales bacterium]|jgi:amphi-Trp domain-containing protein